MFRMIHENYNVLDLERSLAFYQEALGLHEVRRKEGEGFTLCYLADETQGFQLELTWLHDRKEPYALGDNEFHLAFETDDYPAAHAKHEKMGCICYENPGMGIYFISDPDGYWLEIVPKR
ncbi:MAG: VOC family protein [Candidatus Limiplasma sp.]|nr:VOC family protein [Candidatus Limiplasma sp.]